MRASLLSVRSLLNPQDFGNLILLIILALMCVQDLEVSEIGMTCFRVE